MRYLSPAGASLYAHPDGESAFVGREGDFAVVKGAPPSAADRPAGCVFHPPFVMDRCIQEEPLFREVAPEQWAACHLHDEPAAAHSLSREVAENDCVAGSRRHHQNLWQRGRAAHRDRCLARFFVPHRDDAPADYGRSGRERQRQKYDGAARLLLGLEEPTKARCVIAAQTCATSPTLSAAFRREVQAVFQDPFESFNSFYKVDHMLRRRSGSSSWPPRKEAHQLF